ncbi:uncharacterized protein LOC130145921 [Falco biarmicus]|uniref:uncharacterized protein LOC114017499 n=1 Tax=Falco cherrug TaxID=345164 RepID=UPI001886A84F|nr:uncharacterized protein LOC114017499 [Falco cherrug]XP_037237413.1 uncharacterized protein LOC119145234 [Falco rusticolus]XP_056187454.1 uncharacterized protein LOC130145921 [Falco biarmicus]
MQSPVLLGRGCRDAPNSRHQRIRLLLRFPSDLTQEVMWVFPPNPPPNRPRTLQQDFAAVSSTHEQSRDSIGWGWHRAPVLYGVWRGAWGQVTHQANPGCPPGIAGGSWLVAGPACPPREPPGCVGTSTAVLAAWNLGTGLAAAASESPGRLGSGSILQELLQESLDGALPAETLPKTAAQGLIRMQEAMAAPMQQMQSHEGVIPAMSSHHVTGLWHQLLLSFYSFSWKGWSCEETWDLLLALPPTLLASLTTSASSICQHLRTPRVMNKIYQSLLLLVCRQHRQQHQPAQRREARITQQTCCLTPR